MIYQLELHPIGLGKFRTELCHGVMREVLVPSANHAIQQSTTNLLARGASPDDELVVRTVGSPTVEVHKTLGWLANWFALKAMKGKGETP